tara:strand:+ start:1710 stop:2219 length:510 start_codon:yes stop_codon:yes gene_type:complete
MNDFPKKPIFKIETNTPVSINLVKNVPFWQGENKFGKMSYGYNIIHDGVEKTYYASEAIFKLFAAASVRPGFNFKLELRNEKGSDGNIYSKWLLDDKSFADYDGVPKPAEQVLEDAGFTGDVQKPLNEMGLNSDDSVADDIFSFKKKIIDLIETELGAILSKAKNDVPV